MVVRGCQNCGNESHSDSKLYKDFGEQKEILVCYHCRCYVCETDYKRWSNCEDAWDDTWTDEAIVTTRVRT